jgi:hypothetical protein
MDVEARHVRTARLLEAKLETLALASARVERAERSFDVHIVQARAATRNAVDLRLLSPEEAGAIWAAVAERHPGAGWCAFQPSRAA